MMIFFVKNHISQYAPLRDSLFRIHIQYLPHDFTARGNIVHKFIEGTDKAAIAGYSHLSDTEAPIIPTNSKAPNIPTVF